MARWVVGRGMLNPGLIMPDGSTIVGPGVNTTGAGSTIAGMGKLFGLDLLGALDLAESNGLVTTLSQPNLTALSGETVRFPGRWRIPDPAEPGPGHHGHRI